MSLLARLTLVSAVALGGCGWDGPATAVRVVPPAAGDGTTNAAVDGGRPDTGGGDGVTESAGGVPASDGGSGASGGEGADVVDAAGEADGDIAIIPPFPTTVAVVGDSLTLSARDEITTELARLGLDVLIVDGVESRRMTAGSSSLPSGLDAIGAIREGSIGDPDLWVIALGTNDVGAQVDEQRFRDDLRATLAGVGSGVPVVWVDIWIRDRRDAVVTANGVIREELAGRVPPSGVVGWFAHGADDGLVTGDGVHLTDRGRAAFANAIVNQIRSIYHR